MNRLREVVRVVDGKKRRGGGLFERGGGNW